MSTRASSGMSVGGFPAGVGFGDFAAGREVRRVCGLVGRRCGVEVLIARGMKRKCAGKGGRRRGGGVSGALGGG